MPPLHNTQIFLRYELSNEFWKVSVPQNNPCTQQLIRDRTDLNTGIFKSVVLFVGWCSLQPLKLTTV
jgi:hypothetical protein